MNNQLNDNDKINQDIPSLSPAPIQEIKDEKPIFLEEESINEIESFFTKKNIITILIIILVIIFLIIEIVKLNNSHKTNYSNNKINDTTKIIDLPASEENEFDGNYIYFKESIDDILTLEMPEEFIDETKENNIKIYKYTDNKNSLVFKIAGVQNYYSQEKIAASLHNYYKNSSTPSNKIINKITWTTVRRTAKFSSNKFYFTNYNNRLYKIEIDFTDEELLNKFEEEILTGIIFK